MKDMRTNAILGFAAGAVLVLTACDHTSTGVDDTAAANSAVANALNADKNDAVQLLAALRKQDPSISDVYFKGDPTNRMIVIARTDANGNVVTTEVPQAAAIPPGATPGTANASGTQNADSGGSGLGSMLAAGAAGMLAGHLLSNALSPNKSNWSAPMSSSSYSDNRERERRNYASAAGGVYRSNYVSNLRSGASVPSAASSSSSSSKAAAPNTVGRSSGGSFASSGARAGGYGGGASSGG